MTAAAPVTTPLRPLGMSPGFIIPFCGALMALVAFSCDILLPTFFDMQRDFGVAIERVQAVVPIFLLAAASGQMLFGPLSDAFGRKPVLYVGLTCYLAGCVACGFAGSVGLLYAGRVLQGMGAACGVVIARTILRDTHSGADLARAMALSMAIFAIGPLTAPLIGACLMMLAGWRGTFVAVGVLGVSCFLAAIFGLKETNRAPDRNGLQFGAIKSSFLRVVRHHQSRYFLFVAALLQLAVILLVTSSPRLFQSQFGVDPGLFAIFFAIGAVGIIVGQLVSHRAIARFGVVETARIAAVIYLVDAALIAITIKAGVLSLTGFVILLVILNASFLVVMANCISLVIDPHREIAGFASSLYGFVSQASGSVLAMLVLPWLHGEMFAWAVVQAGIAIVVLSAVFAFRPRPMA